MSLAPLEREQLVSVVRKVYPIPYCWFITLFATKSAFLVSDARHRLPSHGIFNYLDSELKLPINFLGTVPLWFASAYSLLLFPRE